MAKFWNVVYKENYDIILMLYKFVFYFLQYLFLGQHNFNSDYKDQWSTKLSSTKNK